MVYKARVKVEDLGNKRGHVTVEIKKDTYQILTNKAIKSNMSIRELVNSVLLRDIENEKFLKRIAPALSLIHITDQDVLIRDENNKKSRVIQISIHNGSYWCDVDDSNNCKHIRFMLILPESIKFKDQVKTL